MSNGTRDGRRDGDGCEPAGGAGVCSSTPPAVLETDAGPVLAGTRVPVAAVIALLAEGAPEPEAARRLGLTPAQVRLAADLWERRPLPLAAAPPSERGT